MSNEPTKSADKKSYKWLALPFGLLIILIIIKLATNSKKDTPIYGAQPEPSQLASGGSATAPANSPPPTSHFSPDEIVQMVEKNEDYIAGVCKKNDFIYMNSDGSEYKYRKTHSYDGRFYLDEQITTWKDFPNRLNYCIVNENLYARFVSTISQQNPKILSKSDYDRSYPDSTHFLINDCVFIPIGFKKEFDGYCIIAIRKDHIITKGSGNSETGDALSPNSYVIKSDVAYIYERASEYAKTSMTLKSGKRVEYIETVGEFIKCKYNNDEGIPIEGYIMVNDVGRAK